MDFLYLCPPIKCNANCIHSSLKVPMELDANLLNHILAGPFNVVGKARHMILSETPCKCMRVLTILSDLRDPLTRHRLLSTAYETSLKGGTM